MHISVLTVKTIYANVLSLFRGALLMHLQNHVQIYLCKRGKITNAGEFFVFRYLDMATFTAFGKRLYRVSILANPALF